jgi:hypothetical protein
MLSENSSIASSNPPSTGAPIDLNESQMNQNVYKTYGDYAFMKRVYAKYDPTRYDSFLGPPRLGNAGSHQCC